MKGRKLSCSYLYTDGTLIQIFDESRLTEGREIMIGQTADVTLGYCTFSLSKRIERFRATEVQGRIVFSRYEAVGVLELARGGKIEATMPNLEQGSQNTKKRGLEVQYVSITSAKGLKLDWCEIPSLIGGTFCLQDDAHLVAPIEYTVGARWGDTRVMRVKDLRPKVVAA